MNDLYHITDGQVVLIVLAAVSCILVIGGLLIMFERNRWKDKDL